MAQLINFGVPLLGSELSSQAGRAFAQALEESTGRPLMLRVVGSYSELADGLADGSLDFGWLPPVEAYQLAAHAGVELLLHAVRGGEGFYHGLLFAQQDSPLQSLEQLSGRSVAFVHRRSASGFLVPSAQLRAQGVQLAAPPFFCGSHGAVVQAVADGRADAGAGYGRLEGDPELLSVADASWLQLPAEPACPMRVLGHVGPIPTDAICAWPGISRGVREELLLGFAALMDEARGRELLQRFFGTPRFVPPDGTGTEELAQAMRG